MALTISPNRFVIRVHEDTGQAPGEEQILRRGDVVPADHRTDWLAAWGGRGRVVEVWAHGTGLCAGTFVVLAGATRALPGFELLRVDRLGGYQDVGVLEAALGAVTDLARARRRAVEITVGLSTADDVIRARLGALATGLGYRPAPDPRQYQYTSKIDLSVDEEAILARMTGSCRRGIRAIGKNPLEVRSISDPALGPALHDLYTQSVAPTGGSPSRRPWAAIIEYARRNPDSVRLVGTFSSGIHARELQAFALGLRQGDHVEYRAAAMTRSGIRAPLGHALAWDLIRWAKEIGAAWFDFGGLPGPDVPTHLEGIVRFKEAFGGERILFREEWTLETRPLLGAARRAVSRAVRSFAPRESV
jgi:hypothetical protein